jgi:RimJ/RimL family protein N-acetyltransferase
MKTNSLLLQGKHVRLEPLERHHTEGLAAAAAADPSLYQWSPVPQGETEARKYVDTALTWRDAGTAVPFVILRVDDDTVVGSTRFWNLERWSWPQRTPVLRQHCLWAHAQFARRPTPPVCF